MHSSTWLNRVGQEFVFKYLLNRDRGIYVTKMKHFKNSSELGPLKESS